MASPDLQHVIYTVDEGLLSGHPQSPNSASMNGGLVPRADPAPTLQLSGHFLPKHNEVERMQRRIQELEESQQLSKKIIKGYRDTVQDQKWDLKNIRSLQNEKITQLKAELAASGNSLRDARESMRKVSSKKGILLPIEFLDDVRPNPFNAPPEQNLYGKIMPSKKGMLLPRQFLDDVRPNPFNAPPEQNLYGKMAPESGFNFVQFQQQQRTEPDEKNNAEDQYQPRSPVDPCLAQRHSGARKSEPLVDGLRFMTLNEPKFKPVTNDNPPTRNVPNVFNEPQSLNYSNLNTSVVYSEFTLKPHQAYAREWMAKQERTHGIGGLIADEMGLGKTFQTIVLIKDDKVKAQIRGLSMGPTLIAAPKEVEVSGILYIPTKIKDLWALEFLSFCMLNLFALSSI
ncbi:hypothetical protein BDP27DRAFT_1427504 [Rhodocollybia butyracea]|uniref:SNF2 N-terminal domain-containing protein n=1 Tax=Rhodocollybia butyracea TaxID=206335 RepID=A0A9P5PIQ9_9AGAR|nr:hypothetical protein BDP27DRAFT_1427504 [Rhodocollybia butyracea]